MLVLLMWIAWSSYRNPSARNVGMSRLLCHLSAFFKIKRDRYISHEQMLYNEISWVMICISETQTFSEEWWARGAFFKYAVFNSAKPSSRIWRSSWRLPMRTNAAQEEEKMKTPPNWWAEIILSPCLTQLISLSVLKKFSEDSILRSLIKWFSV